MFASQAKECGVQLMVTSGEMQQKLKTNTNSTFNMITENDEFSPLNTRILKSDTVFMDRFKMDQVLRNLISNALKFTPKGGVVTVGISFIPNLDPRSSPPLEQEMVVKPSSQYSCYLTALSCQRAFRCFTGAFRGKVFSSVTCGKDEGQKGNEGGESKEFPGDESRNLKSICSLNSKTRDIERGSPSIGHSVGVSEIVIGDDKRRKSTYDSLLRSSSQSHMLNSLNTSIGIGDSLPEIILNRSNYIVAKSRGGSKSGRNSVNYPNITPNRTDSHDKDMTKFSTIDNDKSGVIHGVLRIEVVDTGAGISEANLRRLFKEVVQFNPEVLQAGGGSGLGLWITNSIVNMHAGVVRAYSAGAGKGSSFTVEIDMLRKYPLSRRDTNSNTPTGPQAALHTRMDLKSNNQSPAISLEIESRNQSFKSKLEVK